MSSVVSKDEKLLHMRDIVKSFGSVPVLKGISLGVERGKVVAIIGPSGSGKSTLLRCATLLENFEGGYLSYGDLVIAQNDEQGKAVYASKDIQAQARTRFGLVFQNFNLFPHFSVLRNLIDAPVRTQKRPTTEVIEHALEILYKMGLSGKEKVMPCELSGGQQQRVAIARALTLKPDILFFDEPTSALDPELTREVLAVIRQLAAESMTMVIVTHEMYFARDVADHIIFMEDGKIVEEGLATELINNPKQERTKAFLSHYGS